MSDVQQDTVLAGSESPLTPAVDRNEPATGGTDSQPSAPAVKSPDSHQLQARQRKLDQHRESVVKGIQDFQAKIEKLPANQLNKRLELRSKLQVFESQLAAVAEEQASLDRERDVLGRSEEKARIDQYVKMRQQLGTEGASIADKLRRSLVVAEGLYAEWKELRDRDRVAIDILRSLSPDQMTASPHFSWSTAVDSNFQVALDQAMRECHRSLHDLHARLQAKSTV